MSPGNRAIDTMMAAYEAEHHEDEYKDSSANIVLVENYPELINSSGYRTSALMSLIKEPPIVKYQHIKMIGDNKLITKCDIPGSFSRWWNNIKHGDIWECALCKGKWRAIYCDCGHSNSFYEWQKSE